MGYKVTLAGQDITNYVQQMTIQIDDTLGQGSGAGGSSNGQGRATTFKMDAALGPMGTAIGAGQTIPTGGTPTLVRQGEVIVYDVNSNVVFGGFATKYTDITQKTQPFVTIEGVDYSTSLQTIYINESFSAETDIYIVNYLMAKYAPWVSLEYTQGQASAYLFTIKNFRNVHLEAALQTIAGISGYQMWVDFTKHLHYVSPSATQTSPFGVSSTPDFINTFPHKITEYLTDDNSAINRIYFYGGKAPQNDFSQDVSPLANGTNKTFVFAFYPRPTLATGTIRVVVNGVDMVVGDMNGTTSKDTFKSLGGLADVLVNGDAKAAIFDVAPPAGATVTLIYRYELPIVTVLTDETSHAYFGKYLDGVISDETIFDKQTAVQRSRVVLVQQSMGLVTLKFTCWRPGLQAGQLLRIVNTVRGINQTMVIQEVITTPIGGGNFQYDVTLGAWNWNLVDIVIKLTGAALIADTNSSETITAVNINTNFMNVGVHDTWTKQVRTMGGYYCRSVALGDGHDAYPGLCTITT